MSMEDGWKHWHYCVVCGKSAVCYNPACPNGDICPDCEERREQEED